MPASHPASSCFPGSLRAGPFRGMGTPAAPSTGVQEVLDGLTEWEQKHLSCLPAVASLHVLGEDAPGALERGWQTSLQPLVSGQPRPAVQRTTLVAVCSSEVGPGVGHSVSDRRSDSMDCGSGSVC